jgi:multiple sugar transport system substrate-binding protein
MLAACAAPVPTPAPVQPTAATPAASESKPTTAPAAPGQTTVRLLTTHGATMQPFITKSLENFAKANPDVKIDHEDLTEGYYDRLNVMLASSTLPDVVNLRSFDMYDWYRQGSLHDVTDYLQSDPDVKPADLVDAILKSAVFEGKYWGLPYDASVMIFFYNKDMFDKAGIEAPKDTWTWDDMRNAAQKLTNPADGTFGFARLPDIADWRLEPWVLSAGVKMINDDRTEWTMVGDDAEKTIQMIVDLSLKDKVAPAPSASTDVNLFVLGKGAMYYAGQWEIPGNRDAVKFNWDVVAFPTGPKGHHPITHGGTYIMYAKTKVPDAAWKIQKWITAQPDWQANVYGASGYSIPALKKVASEAWLAPIKAGKPPSRAQVVLDELGKAVPGSLWPNYQKIASIMSEEMQKVLVSEATVRQALEAVKTRADQAIKEAKS